LGILVLKEILVIQALEDIVVLKEILVILALKVISVIPVLKVILVLKVISVIPVLKEIKAVLDMYLAQQRQILIREIHIFDLIQEQLALSLKYILGI